MKTTYMKTLFKTIIIIIMMFSTMLVKAQVEYTLKDEDVSIDDNGVITDCNYPFDLNTNGTNLTIPNILKEETVTGIEDKEFDDGVFGDKNIHSVVFPESLTKIGGYAFKDNPISEVQFPSSLRIIGIGAFQYNSISGSINFPSELHTIGIQAFYFNGISSIQFPSSIASIGGLAFSNNKSLTSVSFADNSALSEIGEGAFFENSMLISITLPSSNSDGFLFYQDNMGNTYNPADNIEKFELGYVAKFNESYTLQDDDAVVENGVIVSVSDNLTKKDIVIPDELDGQVITALFKGQDDPTWFRGKQLNSVVLPSNLTYIERFTFAENNLMSIEFPASITSIEEGAFQGNKLTNVSFSSSSNLTYLGKLVFNDNESLVSISFPTTSLVNGFVSYVDSEGTLYNLGDDFNNFSFAYSVKFDQPYTLQDDDVEVIEGKITACNDLLNKDIIIPEMLDGQVVVGILDKNYLNGVFANKGLKSVALPSSLSYIGDYAFSNNNLSNIEFPSAVKHIGTSSFERNNLSKVDFQEPINLLEIKKGAFNFNTDLNSITLPSTSNVEGFSGYVYSNGNQLQTNEEGMFIYSKNQSFEGIKVYYLVSVNVIFDSNGTQDDDVIEQYEVGTQLEFKQLFTREGYTLSSWNTDKIGNGTVFSPEQSFEVSNTAVTFYAQWTPNKTNLIFKPNYPNAIYEDEIIDTNTDEMVYLKGSDTFTREGYKLSGWQTAIDESGDKFELRHKYTVPAGGTTFYAIWLKVDDGDTGVYTLTSDDLTVDEEGVIIGCDYDFAITDIIIPDEVDGKPIIGIADGEGFDGIFAFKGLTSVSLPSSLTTIGNNAFRNNFLNRVVFGSGLISIATSVFHGNFLLTSVEFPEGLTTIGRDAFGDCGLTSVEFPSSLTSIGEVAFSGNPLTSVEFSTPSSLSTIGVGSFARIQGLSSINLPSDNSNVGFIGYLDSNGQKVVTTDAGDYSITDFSLGYSADTDEDGTDGGDGTGEGDGTDGEDGTDGGDGTGEGEGTDGEDGTDGGDGDTAVYTLTRDDLTVNEEGVIIGCDYDFTITDIIIPDEVEGKPIIGIADGEGFNGIFAFKELTSVEFPEGLISIGAVAFTGNKLTSVSFPSSLTSIGDGAFAVNGLTNVEFLTPSSLRTIGVGSFDGNKGLSSITLPIDNSNEGFVGYLDSNGTKIAATDAGDYSITDFVLAYEVEIGDGTDEGDGTDGDDGTDEGDAVLSLSDELNGSTMQSYPNPVQNMLTVERSKAMRGQVNVRVFNMVGKEVYSKVYGANNDYMEVDFSALPMGMYFLQMSDENGGSERTRIMKR